MKEPMKYQTLRPHPWVGGMGGGVGGVLVMSG